MNERLAIEVMKWVKVGVCWYDQWKWTGYSDRYMHTCDHSVWDPQSKVDHAMMVMAKIGDFALIPIRMWHDEKYYNRPWEAGRYYDEVWWICQRSECSGVIGEDEYNDLEVSFRGKDPGIAKTPEMAICLAAIQWLDEEKRRD